MDGGDLGARFAQQMLELLREQVAAAATANEAVARQAAVSESLARQLEARPQAIAATPACNAAAEEPAQISRIDDPELEASLMELADREGWWHDDADEVLEQFDWMLVGLMTVQEEYVRYCARKGLDPATALPSLARLADGLKATAEATGAALPPPTAIPAAPPAATPQAKAASATAAPGEATRRRSDVPVSAVFDRYFEMKTLGYKRGRPGETICAEAGVKFRQTTLPNMESTMRLIIGVVGDKPLDEITADEWVSFIELLSRMPKAHGKSSKERRTVREIVEDTDREEAQAIESENDRQLAMGTSPNEIDARLARVKVPRLSVNTCVRHMRDAARVIDYAERHGLVSENRLRPLIWDGEEIRWRKRFASSINREPWRDEIYRLFRTPVFQGKIDPDGEDDALFWGPLLGELGGLRLEEALQLRVEDFRTDEGVPFIDVCMGDAAQTMKSHKSWRKIPLHRHLIGLGILEFLEA